MPPTTAVQQPVVQETASHTHWPPLQRWPAAQPAPPPQVQAPEPSQPSPTWPQSLQSAPAAAQASPEVTVQTPPARALQQPVGQLVASQTQAPAEQRWPAAHGAPPPQVQAAVAEQPSAPSPQSLQVPPPTPQEAATCAMQEPFWQQLVGQEVASHTQAPPEHRWPPGHGRLPPQVHRPEAEQVSADWPQSVHAPPTGPQAVSEMVVHSAPLQQPDTQVVVSHTQVPPEQRWLAAQAAPVPQEHVPAAEQPSAVSPQSVHAAPSSPQVAAVGVAQTPAWQQLAGQEVASHTQAPPEQR